MNFSRKLQEYKKLAQGKTHGFLRRKPVVKKEHIEVIEHSHRQNPLNKNLTLQNTLQEISKENAKPVEPHVEPIAKAEPVVEPERVVETQLVKPLKSVEPKPVKSKKNTEPYLRFPNLKNSTTNFYNLVNENSATSPENQQKITEKKEKANDILYQIPQRTSKNLREHLQETEDRLQLPKKEQEVQAVQLTIPLRD